MSERAASPTVITDLLAGRERDQTARQPLHARRPLRAASWGWVDEAREVVAMLERGDYSRSAVDEIARKAGPVVARDRERAPALALIDFLNYRDADSARELRNQLAHKAAVMERRLVSDSAAERLTAAMRALGISDEELAQAASVKLSTVRSWKRGQNAGSERVPVIANLHHILTRRGLTEERMREWMRTPHERLDGASPREILLGGEAFVRRLLTKALPLDEQADVFAGSGRETP